MMNLDFFNNYTEPVCAFNESNQLIFRNSSFNYIFSDFKSFDKFKKRFNFNLCLLSSENLKNLTPLDIMLKSKENFHTIYILLK